MPDTGVVPAWELYDRLRKAREWRGLEQGDLASDLGVSRNTISAAERGKTQPRRSLLMAWAMRTGVSLHWLETGESPRQDGPDGGSSVVRPLGLEPRTRWFGAVSALTSNDLVAA